MRRLGIAIAALLLGGCAGERAPVSVFAAASLEPPLRRIERELLAPRGIAVAFNFGASSTLARQIEAAPVADLFLSADGEAMDRLLVAGKIDPTSRRDWLANTLVVVARLDSSVQIAVPADLSSAAYRHLAIADPAAAPAGRYARAALRGLPSGSTNLWDAIQPRLAPAADVRAALALAAADPGVVAIVYGSEARSTSRVRILLELPVPAPGIRYCAAVASDARQPAAAADVLATLSAPPAWAIFEAAGFRRLDS